MRKVVVFPDPLGPSRPVTFPSGAVKDTSRTAVTRPKVLVSPRTSISATPASHMNDPL
jgi:hypothetical protein